MDLEGYEEEEEVELEEEVEPEEGDDSTSDLDSDHDEDQIAQHLVEGLMYHLYSCNGPVVQIWHQYPDYYVMLIARLDEHQCNSSPLSVITIKFACVMSMISGQIGDVMLRE